MNDPLHETLKSAPNALELFVALVKRLEGMPVDQVYMIAVNLITNMIRMTTPYRKDAEMVVDDLFRRTKELTLAHYDSTTGRRKNLFPYTQMAQAPFVPNENQIFPPDGR
jgi:hypothetical protein